MKTRGKYILGGVLALFVAFVGTVVFAPSAIAKAETARIIREDAHYLSLGQKAVREGRMPENPIADLVSITPSVSVLRCRVMAPFCVKAKVQIIRGTKSYPAVEGYYLWFPFATFRMSGDPWACQGVRISKSQKPNKSPEPTSCAVTPRAMEMNNEKKKSNLRSTEARVAPAQAVAHL